MNRDEQKSELTLNLFPYVYFGLAAFYSCFDIYALGNYRPKFGQWDSFIVTLVIIANMTIVASCSYRIGLVLLRTATEQLPRPRLALISALSALLSLVVFQIYEIIQPDIGLKLHLLFLVGSVCFIPALIGVLLVKIHQSWFAGHSSTQQ